MSFTRLQQKYREYGMEGTLETFLRDIHRIEAARLAALHNHCSWSMLLFTLSVSWQQRRMTPSTPVTPMPSTKSCTQRQVKQLKSKRIVNSTYSCSKPKYFWNALMLHSKNIAARHRALMINTTRVASLPER